MLTNSTLTARMRQKTKHWICNIGYEFKPFAISPFVWLNQFLKQIPILIVIARTVSGDADGMASLSEIEDSNSEDESRYQWDY